ncbi:electron transport complex subunit RsxC [Photobacterium leiognathi]|uniref:electron transport complex subunit RsxC n=1 Tax=Photobacterium leiognathi TaxID=553611 RepID=UPI0002088458|nr:electron transport complex subunit RsxC [Photobacterium leiognathi]PSW53802.1 electron transport complex subunit RsxC [Photobacterium leiognathi subsp. mandapamensis]GAA04634.1 electron transport complex, RnfABCDGE type, C subunit [Photobacterium leiognathi subsp. mandapamensis svers.1.1.]
MLSIIEQIKQGKLWDFHGGIHPAENKDLSNKSPIVNAGIPQELVLPLKQHIGSKGDIIVAVGDKVQKGQPLTQGDIAMCVPVHAPTSGTITAIEQRTTAHPSGLSDLCIVIAPDQQDTWCDKTTYADYEDRDPAELIDAIRLNGIAGLGGAGFPTARKLQGGLGNVDILIINAAECEPYITADDRLMRDYAEEVIEGVRILRHIISPKLTIIGIEDNKPEAIKALEQHVKEDDNILIRVVPTKYPSGSSKQLVKILTGREVPSQSRSTSVGVIMQNVGTAFAIKRAIIDGEPLIERVVTLTGEAFKERGNVFAMLGTPIAYLLDKFSYKADKKHPRVIIGGSLMGFTLPHSNVPITKMTNCILAPKRKELPLHTYEMACIRCSACADVCPSSLLPQQLQWYAKDQNYEKCEEYNLQDCIECGACAYVCPSEIPLVQYYRQAKAEIWARSQDEINAERARQRFEAKQARMDRDKAERENRFKKAAETRREEMAKTGGDDAVAAAIARVKAKQAAAQNEKPEVKPAVAAAIAAAKAKQAASAQGATSETLPDNSEMAKLREERKRQARERKAEKEAGESTTSASSNDSKKDAVAAAIARAKAKKAQQASEQKAPVADTAVENAEVDPKKAAIAAAVARAKAKKEAQQAQSESNSGTSVETSEADPKKAAVAAAVARAKARKAAQQAQSEITPEPVAETEDVDPKKAAVAAAVARAKARKAAQQAEAQSETTSEPAAETEAVDPKKAAVAAAVARAKARKAAQQAETQSETTPEPVAETEDVDPKKAAVAAAVARAKARKTAQQAEAQSESTSEPVAETEAVDPKKAAVAAAVARAKARKAAQQAAKEQQNIEED